MKEVLNTVKKLLYYSGYYKYSWALSATRRKEDVFLVLMYHDVINSQNKERSLLRHNFHPDIQELDAHFKVLKKKFKLFTLKQIIYFLNQRGELPGNCVAITFDDGYSSFYKLVFPLLQKYNIPATVFILPDWVEKKMTPWWERLQGLVEKAPNLKVAQENLTKFWEKKVINQNYTGLKKFSDFFTFFSAVEEYLKDLEDESRETALKELEERFKFDSSSNFSLPESMTWEQVLEVASAGIEIGSHSFSHFNMSQASLEKIEKEVISSKQEIEKRIDKEVWGYAYPYGKMSPEKEKVDQILKRSGYKYACTANPGVNFRTTELFHLKRMTLPHTKSKALIHRDLLLDFVS